MANGEIAEHLVPKMSERDREKRIILVTGATGK